MLQHSDLDISYFVIVVLDFIMKTISFKIAIFDVYHERVQLPNKIKELKEEGYTIVGASAHGDIQVETRPKKLALVLGNEGTGISKEITRLLDIETTIEVENVESLNVSVAGAILMYEWRK